MLVIFPTELVISPTETEFTINPIFPTSVGCVAEFVTTRLGGIGVAEQVMEIVFANPVGKNWRSYAHNKRECE